MATRNGAPLLLALSLTVLIPSGVSAESLMLVGKPAAWESRGEERESSPASKTTITTAEGAETPNQKRRRLGIPIEASYPAPDQGSAEETPNHRRQRLSLLAAADAQEIVQSR